MGRHKQHNYAVRVRWTGAPGQGTEDDTAFEPVHEVSAAGRPVISGSTDPALGGDPSRYNPEDLLVASMSACHMLWYLHLCAKARIAVTGYVDDASGTMVETDKGGHFTEIVLRPAVTLKPGGDAARARALHERAHALCFIANSVNFPVRCEPTVEVQL